MCFAQCWKGQYAQSSLVSCSHSSMSPMLTKGSRYPVQKSTSYRWCTLLALQDMDHKVLSSCFPPVVNVRTKQNINVSIKVCHRKKCRRDSAHFIPTLAVHLLSQNVKWEVLPIYLKISLVSVAIGRLPGKSSK